PDASCGRAQRAHGRYLLRHQPGGDRAARGVRGQCRRGRHTALGRGRRRRAAGRAALTGMRFLYSLLLYLMVPLVLLRLLWRSLRESGSRQNVGERFGNYRKIAASPVIWVHAVSVGETRASQPLVDEVLRAYPEHYVLLTHMTPTGRETA